MDAHVFRRLANSLAPLLNGARLEKIQSPLEDVFVFTFYAQKRKQHLILKSSRRNPFIYLAKTRPVTQAAPSAPIMRMRKYCAGRRIAYCAVDWLNRKLLLLFRASSNEDANPETWLSLDLREGPKLILGTCPPLPQEDEAIDWPSHISNILADGEEWRNFPMFTPALRRTLTKLDELDGQALLMDLQAGGGDLFIYGEDMQAEIFAWPLPKELVAERDEQVFEDPILATTFMGDALVLGAAAKVLRSANALPHQREYLRLERLLNKLNDEEIRLNNLVALQESGLMLQNIMWQHNPDAKLSSIESEGVSIKLDPRYTLSENMQMFFHKAGRGRRGLQYLVERRENLQGQLQALQQTMQDVLAGAATQNNNKHAKNADDKNKKYSSLVKLNLPKGVEAFHSEDDFIILRGKDAKGNWAALRTASAHDLWLHVEGGPGAHCIIKRHFSGQEIPQTTINEAARLAAIKSWQKDSPHAEIISAEVRHVKPMRNAAAGTVRIDKVWLSFRVALSEH